MSSLLAIHFQTKQISPVQKVRAKSSFLAVQLDLPIGR